MQLLRKLFSQYVMVQENAPRRVNNVRGGSLQGIQVNPTNRDTLRNSNNQPPYQSSVETFAVDVQKKTPSNPCLFCRG